MESYGPALLLRRPRERAHCMGRRFLSLTTRGSVYTVFVQSQQNEYNLALFYGLDNRLYEEHITYAVVAIANAAPQLTQILAPIRRFEQLIERDVGFDKRQIVASRGLAKYTGRRLVYDVVWDVRMPRVAYNPVCLVDEAREGHGCA